MNDGSSVAASEGYKGTTLTFNEDSSKGIKKEGASFQQFMVRFADIGVTIFLFAVLISAFWQSLFRDQLLDWLRYILESN